MNCPNCNAEVLDIQSFCYRCGHSLKNTGSAPREEKKQEEYGFDVTGVNSSTNKTSGSSTPFQQHKENSYQDIIPKPENYVVWSILCILFCFWPLGVVALIFGSRVDTLYNQGKYDEANEASRKAKLFLKIALGLGIALFVLVLFFIGFLAFIGNKLDQ